MVKECKIIVNNEAVTVVKFDEISVRFPSIQNPDAKTVFVKKEGGRYTIVDNAKEDKKVDTLTADLETKVETETVAETEVEAETETTESKQTKKTTAKEKKAEEDTPVVAE